MPSDQKNERQDPSMGKSKVLVAAGLAIAAARGVSRTAQEVVEEGTILRLPQELWAAHHSIKDKFKHTPLPNDSSTIRVLQIEPGNRSAVLQCSLHTRDLKKNPKYTALSYTWAEEESLSTKMNEISSNIRRYEPEIREETAAKIENFKLRKKWLELLEWLRKSDASEAAAGHQKSPNTEKIIILDGKIMKIGPALYGALLELREKRPGSEYWIDALCINQDENDKTEKNSQIPLMGQIYSTAEQVVVWLGSMPALFNPDFTKLNEVLEGKRSSSFSSIFYPIHLVSRGYFSRIWVLQEIALASKLTFLLGHHQFDLDHFLKVVNTLEKQPSPAQHHEQGEEDNAMGWTMRTFSPWWMLCVKQMPFPGIKGKANSQAGDWSLQDWLRTCVGREVTVPHDLIYGGLALIRPDLLQINQKLLQEPSSLPSDEYGSETTMGEFQKQPRLWERMYIDYNAPAHEVLLNLAACILSGPENMNLLSISSRIRYPIRWKPNDLIPSWVPTRVSVRRISERATVDGLGDGFTAATELQNNPKISLNDRTLILDACSLGRARQCFAPIRNIFTMQRLFMLLQNYDTVADAESLLGVIRTLNTLPHEYRRSGDSTLTALAKASTCGFDKDEPRQSPTVLRVFCKAMDDKVKTVDTMLGEKLNVTDQIKEQIDEKKRELHSAFVTLKELHPEAPWPTAETKITQSDMYTFELAYDHRLGSPVSPRKVFFMDSGYIGLGPTGMQDGDEIMLIPGASVPYVFRRVDDAIRQGIEAAELEKKKVRIRLTPDLMAKVSKEIKDLESQIGKRDGWVLIGEAYVEGIMDGEAVADCADRFGRIRIF